MGKLHKLVLIVTGATTLLLLMLEVSAQSPPASIPLEITFNKTTSVVFPEIIKSVDRGSPDLLVQKAKGVENVLQVKAAREHFRETNLTVITSEGVIHHFTVTFKDKPATQVLHVGGIFSDAPVGPSLIFPAKVTESDIGDIAEEITGSQRTIRFVRDVQYKIGIALLGIYIKDDVIFYRFRIRNASNVDYDVDLIRFYIRDLERVRRTASQEVQVTPLAVQGNVSSVKGNSSEEVVYALGKFTIPDAKRLVVEVFEKNGGRNLELAIKNKLIVGADLVP